MCSNYHLYKNKYLLFSAIKYYFPAFKFNYEILDKMHSLGVGSVERDMRSYYEAMYITCPDSGHKYYTDNILPCSTTYDHDPALKFNNYWKVILYLSIVDIYNETYQSIARNNLNGILDVEQYNSKSNISLIFDETHQSIERNRSCDNISEITRNGVNDDITVHYFEMFMNYRYNNNIDVIVNNVIDRYNLHVAVDDNVYQLYLLNLFGILMRLKRVSLKCLFDNNMTNIIDNYEYYAATCITPDIYKTFYINKNYMYTTTAYDYLDLMVDHKSINNIYHKLIMEATW